MVYVHFSYPNIYHNSCSIAGEMTSDMMREANDIRHTLFGAFSPTQNVTHKLRTQLEKVRNASLFKYLLKD